MGLYCNSNNFNDNMRLLYEFNQQHLLANYDELTESERKSLINDINTLDLPLLFNKILPTIIQPISTSCNLTPFPKSRTLHIQPDVCNLRDLYIYNALQNKVGCVVLSGGQGTRLGYSGTKGTFMLFVPSGRTLFDIIIERGIAIGCKNWYIMTSPMNDQETKDYFASKSFYGIGRSSFYFFRQGVLPTLSYSYDKGTDKGGRPLINLSSKSSISLSPDGNGGLYPAILRSGALDHMKTNGVSHLHVFSVDNPLVIPADPMFIGYCISTGADCGNKVLWKRDAKEKVGVMCVDTESGLPRVVEYSDMSDIVKNQRDSDGKLLFGAGNICNHFYDIRFIESAANMVMNGDIPYHFAIKNISILDEATGEIKTNNCIKLEAFIFDIFPLSKNMVVMEVVRDDEFAPVKNKDDECPSVKVDDSPKVAVRMISDMSKGWVMERGRTILKSEEFILLSQKLEAMGVLEISPRVCWGRCEGFNKITYEMLERVMHSNDGESIYLE